ncbi:amidohydrolase family protein [Solirubrobacter ginsenosidimutans]|uniref:Amidohydrolase family protein n=1 Tax=Solirubrobacter ginsenosidimutans TaxID=490573 RepID=A0A9X3N0F4_9ACTN|nr:amidohydrolase family protein [Solirubrobacter ginsenosidimutans]MDA0165026.1 amidohydrolase family protein [Solirubrobacter ginsenosidimutans]
MTARRADIHQHLWPDGLLSSLARRTVAPRLRRDGRTWVLELEGDAPAPFDPHTHDVGVRTRLAAADRLQRVVVAPSAPLGIESLPVGEAESLLDAFHTGVLEAGAPFELWGGLVLGDPTAARVEALLDAGAVGLSLPAGALSSAAGIERLGPALEALSASAAPLFVHPGPAAGSPAWFPALTAYVAEMSTAWHAWAQWGRPAHRELRVVFAMLAGLAPLHAERLAARGGPVDAVHDPLTAFDTSSYGPRALDAMLRVVGVDRLLYGSDRPVIEPVAIAALGAAAEHAIAVTNPERFV